MRILLMLVCVFQFGLLQAEEAPVPEIRTGDRWEFRVRDELLGELRNTFSRTVFQVDEQEIHQKIRYSRNAGADAVEILDRHLNWLDNGAIQWTPHTGAYRFPLLVGKEWRLDFTSRYINKPGIARHQLFARVAGVEKLRVAAGEFDTYRIEYEVRSIPTGDSPQADSTTRRTRWYAPAAKQFVREESEVIKAGRVRKKVSVELTGYSINP